jgi:hypothetical protein
MLASREKNLKDDNLVLNSFFVVDVLTMLKIA